MSTIQRRLRWSVINTISLVIRVKAGVSTTTTVVVGQKRTLVLRIAIRSPLNLREFIKTTERSENTNEADDEQLSGCC